MKRRLIISALLVIITIGCDSGNEVLNEKKPYNQNGLTPSTSIFEGTWKWIETKGVDFGGNHFKQDSTTEGYSMKYKFFDNEGKGGKLATLKSNETDILYLYEYTESQNNNPLQRKVTFDRMTNSAPEIHYWEIKYEQFGGEHIAHLYLRNAQYFTDDCCDGKIEQHYILIDRPNF